MEQKEEAVACPRKRLALFFDGTWNKPESNTNVWRLSLMLAEQGADGVPQQVFYDKGVGTRWYDRISGGAFGAGLPENVRMGYCWLMEHYNPGDEIFIFGFSRGAFTARSLAGMIARCGLLKPDAPMSFAEAFARYQDRGARPIYSLRHFAASGETNFDFEERVLLAYSWYERDLIKMVGVWDTVGCLGIPLGRIRGVSRSTLRFLNTRLSTTVQNSYQALALDEERKPYWAVLWTLFLPNTPNEASPRNDDRRVEQRWFAGCHANVGGGYWRDLLPQRPLRWIQDRARENGLGFRALATVTDEDLKMPPRDSYAEFLNGLWKRLPFVHRDVRRVQADPVKNEDGTVVTVNERIDLSVFRRCQVNPGYRPASLREWAGRKGHDLEAIIARPEDYPGLWQPAPPLQSVPPPVPRITVVSPPGWPKMPKPVSQPGIPKAPPWLEPGPEPEPEPYWSKGRVMDILGAIFGIFGVWRSLEFAQIPRLPARTSYSQVMQVRTPAFEKSQSIAAAVTAFRQDMAGIRSRFAGGAEPGSILRDIKEAADQLREKLPAEGFGSANSVLSQVEQFQKDANKACEDALGELADEERERLTKKQRISAEVDPLSPGDDLLPPDDAPLSPDDAKRELARKTLDCAKSFLDAIS